MITIIFNHLKFIILRQKYDKKIFNGFNKYLVIKLLIFLGFKFYTSFIGIYI